jgi:hypothetical protein
MLLSRLPRNFVTQEISIRPRKGVRSDFSALFDNVMYGGFDLYEAGAISQNHTSLFID